MIKSRLEKELKEANNGKIFISFNKIRDVVGMSRGDVREVLKGIDCLQMEDSRQKKYLVSDVAEAFIKFRQYGG